MASTRTAILGAALMGAAFVLAPSGPASADPAVVSASGLNLRAGPGQQHRVVARMPQGARVQATECGREWCRVRYGRMRGFAVAEHLDRGSGTDALAAVPPAAPAPAAASPVWNDPAPERAARVWRWQDPAWRDRHARKVQWLQRHER